jgi:PAS domain-containing protein
MKALSVYILDDDPSSLSLITEIIGAGYPGAALFPFTDHKSLLAADDLCTGDLFVIDIRLAGIDGRALPALMPADCRRKPFLFVSGFPIEDEDFDTLGGLVVFDFISKPFALRHFLHRVGILLDVCPAPTYPIDDIFDLMIYAPFVAVVLDRDFVVKYCNRQAAALLEMGAAGQVVGRNWLDYVAPADAAALGKAHAALLAGEVGRYGEFSNSIVTASGNIKKIKWFNTPFEGAAGQALTLSVGVASQIEHTVIDKIRRLWGERIQRDKEAIHALRPLVSTKTMACRLPQ